MTRLLLIIWTCMAMFVVGCTLDGEVVTIDGRYRKIYPDQKNGGWYYVDKGERIHLDQKPSQQSLHDQHKDTIDSSHKW